MKKLFLFMTAALLCTSMVFAENTDKGKKKKCAKGKSCASKSGEEAATNGEKKSCDKSAGGRSCCKDKKIVPM
jgi:hypothetical protein